MAEGLIRNDDAMPVVTVDSPTVTEGNAGTKTLTFILTLAGATELPATVDYVTADGTATAGSDYAATSGQITFQVGQTTKTVAVTVNGDTTFEPTETFGLNLTPVADAAVGSPGIGTITNDDQRPTLTITDWSGPRARPVKATTIGSWCLCPTPATRPSRRFATADGSGDRRPGLRGLERHPNLAPADRLQRLTGPSARTLCTSQTRRSRSPSPTRPTRTWARRTWGPSRS